VSEVFSPSECPFAESDGGSRMDCKVAVVVVIVAIVAAARKQKEEKTNGGEGGKENSN